MNKNAIYAFIIGVIICGTSCSTNRSQEILQSSRLPEIPQENIYYLNVSTNALEKEWMYALSSQLNGQTERSINYGRIDVVTSNEVIEIDYVKKWHESIGQALHYSIETKKRPVVALISIRSNDLPELDYIQSVCKKLKIKLIVLYSKNQTGNL